METQLQEYENRRFMIFNVSELGQIDFSTVLETSAEPVLYANGLSVGIRL